MEKTIDDIIICLEIKDDISNRENLKILLQNYENRKTVTHHLKQIFRQIMEIPKETMQHLQNLRDSGYRGEIRTTTGLYYI